jgi:hypothetical protein
MDRRPQPCPDLKRDANRTVDLRSRGVLSTSSPSTNRYALWDCSFFTDGGGSPNRWDSGNAENFRRGPALIPRA